MRLRRRAPANGDQPACVAGLYALVVGGFGLVFQGEGSPLTGAGGSLGASLVATGLAAVAFQPLRDRLQKAVNRLLYGQRDEPYAVLARLGQRVEASLEVNSVLPAIVQTVREALNLPYTAITVVGGVHRAEAETGTLVGHPLRLPLLYGHETVGELIVSPRGLHEHFTPVERRLLEDLACQAGMVVYAVRLTDQLLQARERLVNAREEERRRMRRDLHDGLGPALASMTLQAEAARDYASDDPARADELLADLVGQLQVATADIRRLVYELRPPALDDLGLVGALRAHAAHYGAGVDGLRLSIEAPDRLPPLPAAVEVAAYRIAQEALTNVVRNATATRGARRRTRYARRDAGRSRAHLDA